MIKRRFTTALLSLFFVVAASAADKNLEKDITMVSYEQGWLDSSGTLALKNNSSEEVRNVVFLITYLDMSGNELDYEEFSCRVTIAPGMTKKLDIPAYEHDRNYHYYKSKNNIVGDSPAFKIKFHLKDYNVGERSSETTDDDSFARYYDEDDDAIDDISLNRYDYERSNGNVGLYVAIGIVLLLFVLVLTIGLYVLVAIMAKRRHRSVVVWILLSFIATPLLIIIILLAIGDNENYIDNRYNME